MTKGVLAAQRMLTAALFLGTGIFVTVPATAGDRHYYGTWGYAYGPAGRHAIERDDERYIEREYYYIERRADVPTYAPHVYVPYGSYYADFYDERSYATPYLGERECTIKRKWRNGQMKETIKCDDD